MLCTCSYLIRDILLNTSLKQSGGTTYEIKTGRRDGVVSEASTVDLPFPSTTVSDAIEGFGKKGLSPSDMVTLLGTTCLTIFLSLFSPFYLGLFVSYMIKIEETKVNIQKSPLNNFFVDGK